MTIQENLLLNTELLAHAFISLEVWNAETFGKVDKVSVNVDCANYQSQTAIQPQSTQQTKHVVLADLMRLSKRLKRPIFEREAIKEVFSCALRLMWALVSVPRLKD